MSNKVSVIVNFHNSEKYIKECLNSIINQTYKNLEIILWDNCSNDKTYEIIKNFKDKRIKYFFNKKKEPLYKARNQAILNSTGDLIAFLDSDDWWDKNYIQSRSEVFKLNDYDFFYCNTNFYFEKNKKKKLYKNYNLPGGLIYDSLSKDYFLVISGVIFKKHVFKKYGFFNEKFNIIGDYDFLMKISKSCNAHSINLPLLNYRVHNDNYSKNHSKLFYQEYKIWFEQNFLQKENETFNKNFKFFKNKLSYLEISSLLINESKNLILLKKIFKHNNTFEKLKFLILYLVPKKFFKLLKR